MRRHTKCLAFLVIAVAVTGCGDDAQGVVLTGSDSGQEVQVMAGDRFEVRLESNPSTGYQWRIAPDAGLSIVSLVSSVFEPSADDLAGSPGSETLVFEAVAAGAGVLRLEYVRLFDDPVIPDRIVEYIVRVDGVPFTRSTAPLDTSSASTPSSASGEVITVPQVLDGQGPRYVTVRGFVFWDDSGARVCELLLESFPPQCGGEQLSLTDPTPLALELEESQGIRWTNQPVEIGAYFDGRQLELLDRATSGDADE